MKVSVVPVRVEHEVKLMDFTKWLEKKGGSPREVSDRHRIKSILSMPATFQKRTVEKSLLSVRSPTTAFHLRRRFSGLVEDPQDRTVR